MTGPGAWRRWKSASLSLPPRGAARTSRSRTRWACQRDARRTRSSRRCGRRRARDDPAPLARRGARRSHGAPDQGCDAGIRPFTAGSARNLRGPSGSLDIPASAVAERRSDAARALSRGGRHGAHDRRGSPIDDEPRPGRAPPPRGQPPQDARVSHAQGTRARAQARSAGRGGESAGRGRRAPHRDRRDAADAAHDARKPGARRRVNERRGVLSKLKLTLACWDYDRTRALADGRVRAEGIDLNYLNLHVEETFFRMLRHREFGAAEMSLSSYTMALARGNCPFVAIPVFPSRFFRHSCIFISAKSGIRAPQDLAGKRVGVPEYQMTAPVWIRGILQDEYGIGATSVSYFTGGEEEPGREEKLELDLPPKFSVSPIGA